MLSMKTNYFLVAVNVALLLSGCKPFERDLPPSSVASSIAQIETVRSALEEGVSDAGGGEAAVVADPTGWATLTGKFAINGAAPPNVALPVTKDTEVCAPGGKQVLDDIVRVGPGGVLANVLVYISSDVPDGNPAWIHESYEAARDAEIIFDQKNCIFLTRVGTMWKTQTLKILNSDPVGHNTNLASKRGAKAQDVLIPANASALYSPGAASPAPFAVSCAIHPWMKSQMMVCDHPYFAVTDDKGEFAIPNVPAGVELEFRVWHEKAGYIQEVTVGGQGEKWSKGRFNRTLADGETATIDVSINAGVFQ